MAEGKQIQGSTAVSDKSGAEPAEAPTDRDKSASVESDAGLGKSLSTIREGRGVTREDVVSQTRIPSHYLRMIESSDYSMISDQLYVLPFLRRYASYLDLDPEETAMRFVREVQRSDNNPPVRMAEPVQMHRKRRRGWTGIVAVVIAVAAIGWLYVFESKHHRMLGSEPAAPVAAIDPDRGVARAPGGAPPKAAFPAAGMAGAASARPVAPAAAAIPSP